MARQDSANTTETVRASGYSGHLFVFRGRRGDLIDAIWWDGQGGVTLPKQLNRERRRSKRLRRTTTRECWMACYVIAFGTVSDPETYSEYVAKSPGIVAKYGGEYMVRGGDFTLMEGETLGDRQVVIRFADRAAAEAWYNSVDYQGILPIRQSSSTATLIIVDGSDA